MQADLKRTGVRSSQEQGRCIARILDCREQAEGCRIVGAIKAGYIVPEKNNPWRG